MNIQIVGENGKIVEPAASTEVNNTPEGSVMASTGLEESIVAKSLGMEVSDATGAYSDEIKAIIEYAKNQLGKDYSHDQLAWLVRDLDMRIGSTPFGEKRIYKVARFVILNKQKASIDKELEQYREVR